VATLCVVLEPLFITNTPSYGAAHKVCHGWTFMRLNVTKFDVESPLYDPEWDMEETARLVLLPSHLGPQPTHPNKRQVPGYHRFWPNPGRVGMGLQKAGWVKGTPNPSGVGLVGWVR
jgi:hypothetical protein